MNWAPEADPELQARVAKWKAERERRARQTAHRKVPMPTVPLGVCRWCERTILGRRGKYIGRPDPRRSWCREATEGRDCWFEFLLHSRSETQFAYLVERDGKRCAECGEAPERWRKVGDSHMWNSIPALEWEGPRGHDFCVAVTEHRRACFAEFPEWGNFTMVERVTALEVDHISPLWSAPRSGSLERRRWYFGPGNLQLLCCEHHREKTRREAAQRAALKRLNRRPSGRAR